MPRDSEYLLDILEAARLAMTYVAEKTKEEFEADIQCQDAVIRRLGDYWRGCPQDFRPNPIGLASSPLERHDRYAER